MLNWALIISITLVSTTMLMFLSAYLAILEPSIIFFRVSSRSQILLFSNSFNIFYLVISPLIFRKLNKYYLPIVRVAVLATAIGCVGRYLFGRDYLGSLVMSIIVAIAHVPIITAPYGLLKLFPQGQRGYAASIPLFLPALGINFCIFFGMTYIASGQSLPNFKYIRPKIHELNLIIAVMGVLSTFLTMYFLSKLEPQILQISSQAEKEQENQTSNRGILYDLKEHTKSNKKLIVYMVCWGCILGINWTYGGMFGPIFNDSNLTEKEIAFIGLMANISSAIFSNLGTWLANNYQLSNLTVIFLLNMVGFLGSLFIQASSGFQNPIVRNLALLCLAIVVLRAGFSSFVSLALIELERFGLPSVLISCIFFWVANASNLATIYITDHLISQFSLAILSLAVWICMFIVHFVQEDEPVEIGTVEKGTLDDDEPSREGMQSIDMMRDQSHEVEELINEEEETIVKS